ncbi:MAG: SPOR domain-containing protein [Nitrospirae bacterium]|jgi:cell division septation protein DedD|nr:SPOR domain-containing protein [Nitrospirota bacterium]
MKQTDLKEKLPVVFIGRSFVILSIIITSSLGFILGYYVGKSTRPPVVNQALLLPESGEQKNIYSQEPLSQQPEQQQDLIIKPPETTETTQETRQFQKIPKSREAKKTIQIEETDKTGETHKTRKYTVQVGAFKNISDADALKESLNEKGYKAFVTQAETKKQETIYKVKVGEFNTRKEADLLSVKIRKSEGLKPFVTFK